MVNQALCTVLSCMGVRMSHEGRASLVLKTSLATTSSGISCSTNLAVQSKSSQQKKNPKEFQRLKINSSQTEDSFKKTFFNRLSKRSLSSVVREKCMSCLELRRKSNFQFRAVELPISCST